MRAAKVGRDFLFNLIYMKYILDCINERGLSLELKPDNICLCISIVDSENYKMIYLGEDEVYELLGALHHIQKQMTQNKNKL